MLSIRNGTALAIILSIAFVAIAVTMRDSLPGFSSGSAGTTQLVGNQLMQNANPADTNGEGQVAETPNAGIDSSGPLPTTSWDDDSAYSDDDFESGDDDDDDDHGGYYDEHDDDHGDEDDD